MLRISAVSLLMSNSMYDIPGCGTSLSQPFSQPKDIKISNLHDYDLFYFSKSNTWIDIRAKTCRQIKPDISVKSNFHIFVMLACSGHLKYMEMKVILSFSGFLLFAFP